MMTSWVSHARRASDRDPRGCALAIQSGPCCEFLAERSCGLEIPTRAPNRSGSGRWNRGRARERPSGDRRRVETWRNQCDHSAYPFVGPAPCRTSLSTGTCATYLKDDAGRRSTGAITHQNTPDILGSLVPYDPIPL
jgi:hypothetical protein